MCAWSDLEISDAFIKSYFDVSARCLHIEDGKKINILMFFYQNLWEITMS